MALIRIYKHGYAMQKHIIFTVFISLTIIPLSLSDTFGKSVKRFFANIN